ncbi:MAG: hypothetical protein QXJ00_00095 [Candidatus Nezhaarchaeales archaeon]
MKTRLRKLIDMEKRPYPKIPNDIGHQNIRGVLKNLLVPDIRDDVAPSNILEAIAKYTIGWVFYGIKSGSQRMLDKMLKGFKVSDVYDAVLGARRMYQQLMKNV